MNKPPTSTNRTGPRIRSKSVGPTGVGCNVRNQNHNLDREARLAKLMNSACYGNKPVDAETGAQIWQLQQWHSLDWWDISWGLIGKQCAQKQEQEQWQWDQVEDQPKVETRQYVWNGTVVTRPWASMKSDKTSLWNENTQSEKSNRDTSTNKENLQPDCGSDEQLINYVVTKPTSSRTSGGSASIPLPSAQKQTLTQQNSKETSTRRGLLSRGSALLAASRPSSSRHNQNNQQSSTASSKIQNQTNSKPDTMASKFKSMFTGKRSSSSAGGQRMAWWQNSSQNNQQTSSSSSSNYQNQNQLKWNWNKSSDLLQNQKLGTKRNATNVRPSSGRTRPQLSSSKQTPQSQLPKKSNIQTLGNLGGSSSSSSTSNTSKKANIKTIDSTRSRLHETTEAYRQNRGTTARRLEDVGASTMTKEKREQVDEARRKVGAHPLGSKMFDASGQLQSGRCSGNFANGGGRSIGGVGPVKIGTTTN